MSVEVLELPEKTEAKADNLAPITVFENEITRIKKSAEGLKIADINDKAGYLKVSTVRKEAKKLRVEVEKVRVGLKADALAWGRAVDSKAGEIENKILEIESPLLEMEKAHEAEKERIKSENERILKEKIQKRCAIITSLDAKFNGVTYTLGDATIEHSDFEKLSDDEFQTKVEWFEAEYKVILDAKLEAERIAKDEADKIEAQRVANEAETKRLSDEAKKLEDERKELENEKAKLSPVVSEVITPDIIVERPITSTPVVVEQVQTISKGPGKSGIQLAKLKAIEISTFNDMSAQIIAISNGFTFKTEDGVKAHEEFKKGLQILIDTVGLKAE